MEQNTVIINIEEYNKLREGYLKWEKGMNEMQKLYEEKTIKNREDYNKELEEIVNKLIGKTHTVIYLGKAPEYMDSYRMSANYLYQVVPIDYEATIQKKPKRNWFPNWFKS